MHAVDPQRCVLPDGRYLVVGDLQNNYNVIPYLIDRPEKILFIGDFVDSHDFTRREQFNGFMHVLNLIESDRAIALFGNHEMSYMGPRSMRCSGHSGTMQAKMMPYLSRARKLLMPYLYHEATRTLFTHAGVTKALWDRYDLTFETFTDTLYEWSQDPDSPFYGIGCGRGGQAEVAGPLWCDWDTEFDAVDGLTQVVGHSSYKKDDPLFREGDEALGYIRVRGSNLNVDCLGVQLDVVIFDTADGSFTGTTLEG